MLKLNPQCGVIVFGGGAIGLSPHKWDCALQKRTQTAPSPPTPCEDSKKIAVFGPGSRASADTKSARALFLEFSPPEL